MNVALVVEDEPGIAEVVAEALGDFGFQVHHAANGHAGLAKLRELNGSNPDVIISDYMMPIMDGLVMIRAVRTELGLASVPVIVMSAVSPPLDGIPGPLFFLKKPFLLSALVRLVDRAIART